MGDYRMLAGIAVFITIIFAVMATFGTESGDTSVRAVGPEWPPRFPSFQTPSWGSGTAPGCDIAVLCLNVIAFWLGAIGGVIVGGAIFIGGVLVELLELLLGIVTFHFEGLPPRRRVGEHRDSGRDHYRVRSPRLPAHPFRDPVRVGE